MRFSLPALSAAQQLVATRPETGVDSSQVFVTPLEIQLLGRIVFDAAGANPVWYPTPGATLGAGLDIHLRCDTPITVQAAAPSITLDCTLVGPVANATAVATLAIPAWVADQTHVYPVGHALDFVPQGVGNSAKLVTAIAGVNASANIPGSAIFSVYGSPLVSKFIPVGYKRGIEGPYNIPGSVPIADGYNPSAAIKAGRAEVPELNFQFVHIDAMAGVTRYNGHRVSFWNKIVKDNSVHTANIVYVGVRPNASPNRGDGNDEVIETVTGPYENFLSFSAL